MKVGLIGLPQSGKTALFNALTRGQAGTGAFGRGEAHVGVVRVPDARFEQAVEVYAPKKVTPATIEFTDGAARLGEGRERFSAEFFAGARLMDALVLVARAFEHPAVPPPEGGLDPLREAQSVFEELLLADLQLVETRLERLTKSLRAQKAGAASPEASERALLTRLHGQLDQGRPLSALDLSGEEERQIRSFAFLTLKPILVVVNVGEDDLGRDENPLLAPLRAYCEAAGEALPLITLCAQIEAEVAQMGPDEERDFLLELGIDEPARDRLIRATYARLGLLSFFTVGEDEVRAWTVPAGSSAQAAAGTIHTDLARGFIRAEVVAWDDFAEAGSFEAAKSAGKMRLEGKEYTVKDGDILHVRFKV